MQCEICGAGKNLLSLPVIGLWSATKALYACPAHYREVREIAGRLSV